MTDLKIPNCINCGSHQIRHDSVFGFYKCESCSTVWGNDADDPDYDEDSNACSICSGSGWVLTPLGKDDCPLCGGYGVA